MHKRYLYPETDPPIFMCEREGLGVGAGWRAGPNAKEYANEEMAKKIRNILQSEFNYWNTV